MKYSIALCVFAAFACSTHVHAGIFKNFVDGPLKAAINVGEKIINEALIKLETAADSYQDKVNKQVNDIENEINNIKLEVQSKVKDFSDQNTVQLDKINQLPSEQGLDISKCEIMGRKVENDTLDLTNQATSCITNRLQTLKERANPLQEKVKKMHDVFVHHLQVNKDCVNNPNSGFLKKLACVTENQVKASFQVTTRLPGLLTDHAMFLGSELFVPVRGVWCMSQSEFLTSAKRLEYSVKSVEQCVADELKRSEENSKVTVPNVPNPEVVSTKSEASSAEV